MIMKMLQYIVRCKKAENQLPCFFKTAAYGTPEKKMAGKK